MSEAMFHRLAQQLTEHFGIPAEEMSPEATLDEVGLDSMALVELLLVMEEHLGTDLPEYDGPTPKTLGELAALVERHASGAPAAVAAAGGAAAPSAVRAGKSGGRRS